MDVRPDARPGGADVRHVDREAHLLLAGVDPQIRGPRAVRIANPAHAEVVALLGAGQGRAERPAAVVGERRRGERDRGHDRGNSSLTRMVLLPPLFGPSVRRYPTRVLDASARTRSWTTSAASGLFELWADLDARSGIVDLSVPDSG